MTEPSLFVLPHADRPARWLLCTLCRWCWNDILCWQPDPESAVSGTKQPDLMWVCSRSSLCSVCSWKNGWNRRNPPDFTQLGESFSPLSTFVSRLTGASSRPLVVSSSRPLVVSLLTAVLYHYILFFSKVYLAMMPCKHTPSLTIFAHCSRVILDVDFFFFFLQLILLILLEVFSVSHTYIYSSHHQLSSTCRLGVFGNRFEKKKSPSTRATKQTDTHQQTAGSRFRVFSIFVFRNTKLNNITSTPST